MATSECGDGCSRLLACCDQFGFELVGVGPVGALARKSRSVCFSEHGVHDGLRAHDLARWERSVQDGVSGCLQRCHHTHWECLRAGGLARNGSWSQKLTYREARKSLGDREKDTGARARSNRLCLRRLSTEPRWHVGLGPRALLNKYLNFEIDCRKSLIYKGSKLAHRT